jgi:hypothetical protein
LYFSGTFTDGELLPAEPSDILHPGNKTSGGVDCKHTEGTIGYFYLVQKKISFVLYTSISYPIVHEMIIYIKPADVTDTL